MSRAEEARRSSFVWVEARIVRTRPRTCHGQPAHRGRSRTVARNRRSRRPRRLYARCRRSWHSVGRTRPRKQEGRHERARDDRRRGARAQRIACAAVCRRGDEGRAGGEEHREARGAGGGDRGRHIRLRRGSARGSRCAVRRGARQRRNTGPGRVQSERAGTREPSPTSIRTQSSRQYEPRPTPVSSWVAGPPSRCGSAGRGRYSSPAPRPA